jgi:RNA polymerase sigma-70 factor, ECF subfamily
LRLDPAALDRLFRHANAARWALSKDAFDNAIQDSVDKAFKARRPSARELDRYLSSLHLEDLALACACALGQDEAWEHFIREHRPVLYRAADAIDRSGGARDLADSLYADLYGLNEDGGTRRSLLRYFHGRSSLATWLRAVLAQRHVDRLRSGRRTVPLPDDDAGAAGVATTELDPDRSRLVRLVHAALGTSIDRLQPGDRLRLRSYYVLELTLAEIGRVTGEHEATVSRHLSRTRRVVRESAERLLREDARLSEAEIARGFELALEDPGGLNAEELFSPKFT